MRIINTSYSSFLLSLPSTKQQQQHNTTHPQTSKLPTYTTHTSLSTSTNNNTQHKSHSQTVIMKFTQVRYHSSTSLLLSLHSPRLNLSLKHAYTNVSFVLGHHWRDCHLHYCLAS